MMYEYNASKQQGYFIGKAFGSGPEQHSTSHVVRANRKLEKLKEALNLKLLTS